MLFLKSGFFVWVNKYGKMQLSCCVQLRPELNEMICTVAPNRSANGEWFGGDQPDAF